MPKVLFALPEAFVFGTPLFEDVTADGQRFLLNLPVQARTMRELPRRVRVAWLLTCLVTM